VNDLVQLPRRVGAARTDQRSACIAVSVIWSPLNTYVDADVELAPEVSLLLNTVLKDTASSERGARSGPTRS